MKKKRTDRQVIEDALDELERKKGQMTLSEYYAQRSSLDSALLSTVMHVRIVNL